VATLEERVEALEQFRNTVAGLEVPRRLGALEAAAEALANLKIPSRLSDIEGLVETAKIKYDMLESLVNRLMVRRPKMR
jgi:hypothetical protein